MKWQQSLVSVLLGLSLSSCTRPLAHTPILERQYYLSSYVSSFSPKNPERSYKERIEERLRQLGAEERKRLENKYAPDFPFPVLPPDEN